MWTTIFSLTLVLQQCLSYPYGAPKEACKMMVPGHGEARPQSMTAPYKVLVDRDTFSGDDNLQVTIVSTDSEKFKGFLIQARHVDPRLDTIEPIGHFLQIPGSKIVCPQRNGHALTHTSGNPGSDQLKTTLQLTWQARSDSIGDIKFWVTVVMNYNRFWAAEESKVIRDTRLELLPGAMPRFNADIMVQDQAPLHVKAIDASKCGKSIGCYRNPPSCQEAACDIVVTWYNYNDTFFEIQMSADTDGWVAVGLSEDTKMGKDDVMECVFNKSSDKVMIQSSWNSENGKINYIQQDSKGFYDEPRGQRSDSRISCNFRRMKKPEGRTSMFNLNNHYHLLLAKGPVTDNGVKQRHLLDVFKYPYVSPSKVSFRDKVDISDTARYPLVKVHGILMLIAYMFCACTAVMLAKYYKPMWPNDQLCGEKIWFAVHRGCMIGNVILVCIAFILIFVHVGGYSQMPNYPDKAHPPLGITTFILMFLNPLIAICRCKERSKYRPIFNWIHWFIGFVAMVLALPTIFIGLNLPKAHVPWWATWVMVAFMLFHLIIELLLELHGCMNSKKQKNRNREYEMGLRGHSQKLVPEPVGTRFKRIVLAIYLFVTIILGLIMIIAIATG